MKTGSSLGKKVLVEDTLELPFMPFLFQIQNEISTFKLHFPIMYHELGRPTKVQFLVLFRTTVHSPGGAERGRKSLAPLPALTTIYVVSIKLSLDERKSLPKPKVTILSVKLCLTTNLAIPSACKGNFDRRGKVYPHSHLRALVGVFLFFSKLRDVGLSLFRKLTGVSQVIPTLAASTAQQQQVSVEHQSWW